MSGFEELATDRVCGCLGCTESAAAVIRHPTHGEQTVCDRHTGGYVVVRDV